MFAVRFFESKGERERKEKTKVFVFPSSLEIQFYPPLPPSPYTHIFFLCLRVTERKKNNKSRRVAKKKNREG